MCKKIKMRNLLNISILKVKKENKKKKQTTNLCPTLCDGCPQPLEPFGWVFQIHLVKHFFPSVSLEEVIVYGINLFSGS